ncbi:MAG: arylsulfatase A-like enzyme [Psychromonas sp.]|jgi:arylsulfatase A-like enzyme|uniref:sulfatase family protein n=1 Tax=Psychromonas sp. TaxID=1884585 RepID=UPI0039E3CE7C
MKKNIVILHTDQQRFDSLGCNGNPDARTPNIDALAKDGCNFSRHISTNPACMPSRASLMTGLYVPGHGVSSNGIPLWRRDNGCLDSNNAISKRLFGVSVYDKIPTMADIFSDNGYSTALFGKIHLEPHLADPSYHFYESYSSWKEEEIINDDAPYYGFQTRKIILGHGEQPCGFNRGHYGRWLKDNHPDILEKVYPGEDINTKEGSIKNDIYLSKLPSELHNSMWLAEEACQYFDEKKDANEPIFMFVGYPDPHHPFTPPEDIGVDFLESPLPEFAKKSDLVGSKPQAVNETINNFSASKEDIGQAYRHTAASNHLIDKSVGKIIEKLKALGIYDDTTIIFTSDHGDFLGDLDMICKYDMAFNNLLQLPFILKPASSITDLPCQYSKPMSNADVLPTLLAMNQIDIPSYMQGVDIFGTDAVNNTPMVTCYTAREANRNLSLYTDIYRYTYYIDTGEEELYDHVNDIKELHNLADKPSIEAMATCKNLKDQLFKKHITCDLGIFNHYGLW